MFKKIVDMLKEVFWLKKTPKRTVRKTPRKKSKKPLKKPVKSLKPLKPVKALMKTKIVPKPAPEPKEKKVKKLDIDPTLTPMGEITHYFDRIKVAVLKINAGTVLIGDRLTIVSGKIKVSSGVMSYALIFRCFESR